MRRPALFLIAITFLACGVERNVLAQKGKQPDSKAGSSRPTAESEYEKGNSAFDLKQWDKARLHYDEALRLNAGYTPALVNRGRVALVAGKLDEAAADFQKAIELKPELPVGRTFLAAVLLDQGKHAEAIAQAGKSIELDSKQGFAWYIRGTARIHKEEYKKGIEDLNEAAKLLPGDPLVYNNRGIAWQKLGDEAKARADFERRNQIHAKQDARLRMEQAKARFDQIDFSVQSLQRRRPVPVRGGVIVPQVPEELLRERENAWRAFQEASKVYSEIP